eukprot:jgi/Chlat1/6978/Chrsp55S09110
MSGRLYLLALCTRDANYQFVLWMTRDYYQPVYDAHVVVAHSAIFTWSSSSNAVYKTFRDSFLTSVPLLPSLVQLEYARDLL